MNEYITPKYTKMKIIEMLIQIRGKMEKGYFSFNLKLSLVD